MNANKPRFNLRLKLYCYYVMLVLLPSFLDAAYWQQKVIYDIDVTLVDSTHQLIGHESLTYINNSPDKLDFIWMHLWPNAYKNNRSALAKQKFGQRSTKMHFLPDSSFGWIEISQVSAAGEDLKWEYRSEDTLDVAKFHLSETLLPGDTVCIDLDFTVQIPNVLSRMGHIGQHFELTQWYPKPAVYDMFGWHPISYLDLGEFYSEWGDYQVSITIPENYRVAATGVLQDSTEIAWRDSLASVGNAYLDSFRMDPKSEIPGLKKLIKDKPTSAKKLKTITFIQANIHDFAWFADKRFMVTGDTIQLESGNTVQSWTFMSPENLNNYQYANDYMRDAVTMFSNWFMEYPYEHVTVVDGNFSAGGGMEYPMITLINDIDFLPVMEMAIVHEVGHNWFYGLSGNNERDFPWLDEGLNSYAENRYWQLKYPDNSMLAHDGPTTGFDRMLDLIFKDVSKDAVEEFTYYMCAFQKLDQPANLESEAFSEINYGTMAYKKAALSTETLHAYLGEALIDSIWQEYFRQWAFKHPHPADLRAIFEDISGEDLSWYFDDMIGSTNRIDYSLNSFSSAKSGAEYETTIRVENLGDFAPPLPIGLDGKAAQATETVWVLPEKGANEFKIKTEFPVMDVELDPDLILLDVDRRNNDKNLNLDFDLMKYAINPGADYVVTVVPYLWYDRADMIYPGLIFTRNNLLSWGTSWYLRSFYGTRTKTGGFAFSSQKRIFPSQGREINFQTRLANSWFQQSAGASTTFKARDMFLLDNSQQVKVSIFAQNLSDEERFVGEDTIRYLDPLVWTGGKRLKATVSLNKSRYKTLSYQKSEVIASWGVQKKGRPYGKLQASWKHRLKYSRKGSIRSTLFAGMTIGDIPQQERFYLSTDVDPEFARKTIFSRNDNWFTPGHYLFYPTAYTIPGYPYSSEDEVTPSSTSLVGAKLRVDIPRYESIHILGGIGMALNDDNWQAIGSLSPGWQSGPFQLQYTPLHLDSGKLVTDWTRFQIVFDMTTFGKIQIGI